MNLFSAYTQGVGPRELSLAGTWGLKDPCRLSVMELGSMGGKPQGQRPQGREAMEGQRPWRRQAMGVRGHRSHGGGRSSGQRPQGLECMMDRGHHGQEP